MLWDEKIMGFGVRVGKSAKTFIVLIGKGRRHKLGRYPLLSLHEARGEAKRVLAEKHLGKVKPTHTAWNDARDGFLASVKRKNKASTLQDYTWRLKRHFPFDRTSVADIGPRDILKRLALLSEKPAEHRYAFVVVRAFFNWCVAQHILDRSPMANLEAPAIGKPRERTLAPAELRLIWHACNPEDTFERTIRALMLTGTRKREVQHIVRDADVATIAAEHTKNRRQHVFPLGPMAQDLLDRDLSFNGWGKSKARLDKSLSAKTGPKGEPSVQPWTVHDIRRTYATIHAQIGTPPHVIERLLNHVTGTLTPLARVYNQHRYFEEMKVAVHQYEKHLASVVL